MSMQYLYSSASTVNNVVASKCAAQGKCLYIGKLTPVYMVLLHEESKIKGRTDTQGPYSPQKAHPTYEFLVVT